MRTHKLVFLLLTATLIGCKDSGGDANYQRKTFHGYRGGFIKGIKLQNNALDFIVLGDWGCQGEYYQSDVARQMTNATVSLDPDFVISTGDNFYPDGVASAADPLWRTSFEDVYKQFPLQGKW